MRRARLDPFAEARVYLTAPPLTRPGLQAFAQHRGIHSELKVTQELIPHIDKRLVPIPGSPVVGHQRFSRRF